MSKLITTTAVLAALALGAVPVAATANDRNGHDDRGNYGWQGERVDYRGGDRDRYQDRRHDRRQDYRQDRDGYGGDYARQGYYGRGGYPEQGYNPGYRGNRYNNGYNNGGYYQQRGPQYGYNQNDRYRCNNGSTGTIIGAIAGGLIGNSVAGRGDRTLGTILGGGVGALAGNSIDKNNRRC